MSVFITSDLHLGHPKLADLRGFNSVSEHDDAIMHELSKLGKRTKLFILGDIAWNETAFSKLSELECTMDAVLGNHDTLSAKVYAETFNKVYGMVRYKNLWLSHCPIHQQEMYRCMGNVHGHIHKGAGTPPLPYPYFNVNVDFNDTKPVSFLSVLDWFEENKQ